MECNGAVARVPGSHAFIFRVNDKHDSAHLGRHPQAPPSRGEQQLPAKVHVQSGVNRLGKKLHYFFNYSGDTVKAEYLYGAGTNLLDGQAVAHARQLTLKPWDLAIVEEK